MILNKIVIFLINTYKILLSPMLGHRCRFYPSCSSYGVEAFQRQVFYKAVGLLFLRLIKCHPFSRGGYDPVPIQEK